MGTTANEVGGAHHHCNAMAAARLGCLNRRGKFGKANAVDGRGCHLFRSRIVMARKNGAKSACLDDGPGFVFCAVLFLKAFQRLDMFFEFRIVHAAFFGDIGLQRRQIAELALTRGVIHQADDANPIFWSKGGQFIQQRLRACLGPQVQEMTDLEHACRARRQQFVGQFACIIDIAPLAGMNGAHPHGVEHGCNPGRGKFGIMCNQGGQMGPVHFGARLDMPLDIVGMQLDQTGQNPVARAIHRTRRDVVAFHNLGNHALFDCDRPGDHPVGQHQLRIGKTQVVGLVAVTRRCQRGRRERRVHVIYSIYKVQPKAALADLGTS